MASLVTKKTDFPNKPVLQMGELLREIYVEEWVLMNGKFVLAVNGGVY